MSLPTSRNRTYTPGVQIVSGDLNDLQDGIVALNASRARSIWIPASSMIAATGSTSLSMSNATWTATAISQTLFCSLSSLLPFSAGLAGITITKLTWRVKPGGTGTIGVTWWKLPNMSTTTTPTAVAVVNGTSDGTSNQQSIGLTASLAMGPDITAYATWGSAQSGDTVYGLRVDYTITAP